MKNPVAKDLRTPKYKQRKVENKKKYKRKKKIAGYYIWTTMAKKKFYMRMRDDTRDRQSIHSRTI